MVAHFLDAVPFSGIISHPRHDVRLRIRSDSTRGRQLRYARHGEARDAPRIDKTTVITLRPPAIPRLPQLLAAKLRTVNCIPIESPDEVMVTNGGIHGLFLVCQALLEPATKSSCRTPVAAMHGNIKAARGCRWAAAFTRTGLAYDLANWNRQSQPKTRAIVINSPQTPTAACSRGRTSGPLPRCSRTTPVAHLGRGVRRRLVRRRPSRECRKPSRNVRADDLGFTVQQIVLDDGASPGTSRSHDAALRERMKKRSSDHREQRLVGHPARGFGALEGPQDHLADFRQELQSRRDLFLLWHQGARGWLFSGAPPRWRFYAFLRIYPAWRPSNRPHPLGIVGDGGIPDRARPHRLRA